jgi:phage-related protein
MYWFSLDNQRCDHKGIIVDKRTGESAPTRKIQTASSNYTDGAFVTQFDTFETVEKSFDCNFVEQDYTQWHEHWRAVKRWLLKDHDKLRYSDDPGIYRKILNTTLSASEREVQETGNFTVTFLLEPYEYYDKGAHPLNVKDVEYNIYNISHPTYIITGTNKTTLTVNGKDFTVWAQNRTCYIDTDLRLVYDANKNKLSSEGDFTDLYLLEGKNTINLSSGNLKVVPNWRSL